MPHPIKTSLDLSQELETRFRTFKGSLDEDLPTFLTSLRGIRTQAIKSGDGETTSRATAIEYSFQIAEKIRKTTRKLMRNSGADLSSVLKKSEGLLRTMGSQEDIHIELFKLADAPRALSDDRTTSFDAGCPLGRKEREKFALQFQESHWTNRASQTAWSDGELLDMEDMLRATKVTSRRLDGLIPHRTIEEELDELLRQTEEEEAQRLKRAKEKGVVLRYFN